MCSKFLFSMALMLSSGNGVFNPTPTPPGSGPSQGTPTGDFCGKSFEEVVASCDRLCESNADCLPDEVCFGSISSNDCNGVWYSDVFFFSSTFQFVTDLNISYGHMIVFVFSQ